MARRLLKIAVMLGGVGLASLAAGDAPWNWGHDIDYPEFAQSQAICRQLGPVVIPIGDRLGPNDIAALKGCDAEQLYYGIGTKTDYIGARKCALFAYEHGDKREFSGSTILMQVYANGLGGPADRDLATRLACARERAPAENDGRVLHLRKLRKGEVFSWCDDNTSGYAGGVCAGHDARIADHKRQSMFAATVARLPEGARSLFPSLQRTESDFSAAHGNNEVDLTGTLRSAFVIEAEQSQDAQFLTDLQTLVAGKWQPATHADAIAADRELNQSYRKALIAANSKDRQTTVVPQGIRTAQRAWLPYRDAWVRLGVAAHVPADAVVAHITRLRQFQLDNPYAYGERH